MTTNQQKSTEGGKELWSVHKFGGLSVGCYLKEIPRVVSEHLNRAEKVGIVCSARSSVPHNTEGITSRLLRVVSEGSKSSQVNRISEVVSVVLSEHVEEAKANITNSERREELIILMEEECKKLQFLLEALDVVEEASSKSLDLVVKVGEKLSSLLTTAVLVDQGIKAQLVEFDKVLGGNLQQPVNYQVVSETLATAIHAQLHPDNNVAVLPGFMGNFPGGLMKSIGRGYSDITAAAVSRGLQAKELVVWKDVDGLYTADPRIVKTAKLLDHVTSQEAYELTYYGSEAVHPLAIGILKEADIPLHLFNIQHSPRPDRGTLISLPSPTLNPPTGIATALAFKEGVVAINVHSNRKSRSHDFLRCVFATLDRYSLITDLISTSEVHLSMALSRPNLETIKLAVQDLEEFGQVEVKYHQAIISLVGQHMRHQIGVSKVFFQALSQSGINLEMISQGSSEINISVVTEAARARAALPVIHDQLLLTP